MFQASMFAQVPTVSSVVEAAGLSWWSVTQALPPSWRWEADGRQREPGARWGDPCGAEGMVPWGKAGWDQGNLF